MIHKNLTRPAGHWLRRFIHLLSIVTPFLYYWHGVAISKFFHLTKQQLIGVIVVLVILAEAVRLSAKLTVFGQRNYEKKHISSAAWLIFSTGLVLLIAPEIDVQGAGIGMPIICAAALSDIVIGEVRIAGCTKWVFILAGLLMALLVWVLSVMYLGSLWIMMVVAAPATVFAEQLDIPILDDNSTMLLLPLALIIYLLPWI